ncbi:MAG: DNA-processing protein DprA [Candidatus Poribacteria bacterium]|nr:DNA-processing protein DprA [Candidatus Poribacteria bacterium]
MTQSIQHITQTDTNYPKRLKDYLKTDTPETIWIRGNINLLPGRNTNLNGDLWALFCSSKCPGEIILKAHDLAQKFKETDTPTIGGYHSPIEKECLRVLLRGAQPILLCPARSIEKMRPQQAWKDALAEERLLILSIFENRHQSTVALANQRNAFVAALADKICIAHAAEDSKILEFAQMVVSWGKPVFTFDTPANKPLFELGVQSMERGWTHGSAHKK